MHTILIGASTRAAAFSALRAGLKPWCIDLFADADLRAIASVRKIPFSDYPQRLPTMLEEAPPGPLMYTGGLENHPNIIEAIAIKRTILGCDVGALRKARDPFLIAQILADQGMHAAPVTRTLPRPMNEIWLKKPRRGAGGSNISFANEASTSTRGYYFQQFIRSPAYAAAFDAKLDSTALLGVSEQLVGECWLNAKPFQYCGSIGPVELPGANNELIQLGELLRVRCGLRGLFGVDFIFHEGRPWLIEVNPRYTASMEVLEHGLKAAFLSPEALGSAKPPRCGTTGDVIGKAILFASSRMVIPERVPWAIHTDPFTLPPYADIPNAGELIDAGWPILTVFARGSDAVDCRVHLKNRIAQLGY